MYVQQIMSQPVDTIGADQKLGQAAQLMREKAAIQRLDRKRLKSIR